jgi:hypothetical protein
LLLGRDGLDVGVGHLLGCGVVEDDGESGAGQDVQAEVAAAFDPFVVLFGQDGADQADQGASVGEDADDVGAPADLSVEPFLRYPRGTLVS